MSDSSTEFELGSWVTGGACIAHSGGKTWIVRFGIPGEWVRVTVTRRARGVVYADVTAVLRASPARTQPPCGSFGPGLCGGCNLQQTLDEQRRSKRTVVIDCLSRLGGMSRGQAEECVEPTKSIAGAERGLRWRTRLTATRTAGGIGMHLTRSHGLIDVHDCPITDERVIDSVMDSVGLGGGFRAAVGTDGRVGTVCRRGSARVTETITTPRGTQTWSLPVGVFWQVHRGFPQVLGDTVLSMAGDVAGERWWDLYVGAGLLNAFIIDAGALMVDAVESDPRACTAARRALHDRPEVILHEAGVETWTGGHRERPPGVVLDPPRSGCERTVTQQLVSLRVPRIVFVACDPASLARDVRILRSGGYEVDRVVPVDAFPMTHHVETLMLLRHGNPLS